MKIFKIICIVLSLHVSILLASSSVFVIGIGGAVGTGKSTIAAKLQDYFQAKEIRTSVLAQDDYPKLQSDLTSEQIKEANFDDPERLNFQNFYNAIRLLKRGTPVPCASWLAAGNAP